MVREVEMMETAKKLALWDIKAGRNDRPETIKRDTMTSAKEAFNRSLTMAGMN